jgi:acyl dehydratase
MPEIVTIQGITDLFNRVGQSLGESDYIQVTQDTIDQFAKATGDYQWIHVDPERAKSGPFGDTIAHGYLTLSLAPVLLASFLKVEGVSFGINYGTNKVRFPSPVLVNSKVKAKALLKAVEEVQGGAQAVLEVTFVIDGKDKPACVAEVVYRYYE